MNVEYWTEGGYSIQPPSNTAGSACAPSLTVRPASGKVDSPKHRRLAGACASVPALARNTAFPTSAACAPLGCGYISAEQRPVSVRTGGPLCAGERCSVFFCTL